MLCRGTRLALVFSSCLDAYSFFCKTKECVTRQWHNKYTDLLFIISDRVGIVHETDRIRNICKFTASFFQFIMGLFPSKAKPAAQEVQQASSPANPSSSASANPENESQQQAQVAQTISE